MIVVNSVCQGPASNPNTYEQWCLLGCCAVWLLLRTDVSEEPSGSFIRVTRIGELGTTQAATSNRRTLRRDTCHPDEGGAKFIRNVGSYKSHTA
jgi:hypothetical protein